MPLSFADYLASEDKIYGVRDNYIVKYNATTGAKESAAKIAAPLYGPMEICAGSNVLYVYGGHDRSVNAGWFNSDPGYTTNNMEIFTVNPTTLAASRVLGFGAESMAVMWGSATNIPHVSIRAAFIRLGYLWFLWVDDNGHSYGYLEIANPSHNYWDITITSGHINIGPEVWDIDPLTIPPKMYAADSRQNDMEFWQIDWVTFPLTAPFRYQSSPDTSPDFITAGLFVPSVNRIYGVAGNDVLHKWTTAGVHTTSLLGPVFANVQPFRLRLSPLDGKLYLPCQVQDVVIIWDPTSDTGTYKDGFTSPIDVVFTDSKSWAVQTNPAMPLKEIV